MGCPERLHSLSVSRDRPHAVLTIMFSFKKKNSEAKRAAFHKKHLSKSAVQSDVPQQQMPVHPGRPSRGEPFPTAGVSRAYALHLQVNKLKSLGIQLSVQKG